MMLPLPGDVADKIEAFNRGEQPNGINDWRDLLSEGDVATVLLALRNDEMKLKRGAEPSPLEAAKKLLISAAVGSCTCNTKSPELIWHAPDCRYAVLMMALENVEIAATPVAEVQGPPHWRTWNGAVLDAGQRCVTEAKHLPDLPQRGQVTDEMLAISGLNKDWNKLRELLSELYEWCRGCNDFRVDSNLARRIQSALALSRPSRGTE